MDRADKTKSEKLTYDNYLKISSGILKCQEPKTEVPEEVLFIIAHQAFELWFKVVIDDLCLICDYFDDNERDKKKMASIVNRLDRICKIFKLIVQHFEILETMSPMTFMDFRGELEGASGFQSLQFRDIENKLGLKDSERENNQGKDYKEFFEEEEREQLKKSESDEKTLLNTVQKWLGKYVEKPDEFWGLYRDKWTKWSEGDDGKKKMFKSIENEDKYAEIKAGYIATHCSITDRRLSFEAFQGAMFITLYQDEERNHLPYQVLNYIKDIDALVTRWRTIHVMMVHRMIGNKPGTGGSSGVDYLRATTKSSSYRIFQDLYNTSTYIIPKGHLPTLRE